MGKNSMMQSESFSIYQYGSKSSSCFVAKIVRSLFQEFWFKTRGTRTVQRKPVL